MPQMFATLGIKTIGNFKIIWHPKKSLWFLLRGVHSQEIPAVVIQLRKFWWVFLVAYGRWSPLRGLVPHEGLTQVLFTTCMYHWWSIPDSVTVVVSETDHDARKMMSLLCTAQTVWKKDLKKHWFPMFCSWFATLWKSSFPRTPPTLRNNCLWTPPPPPRNFQWSSVGGGGGINIFWNHTKKHIFPYIYTQVCYSHVLSLELSIKTILMQALYSEEMSH